MFILVARALNKFDVFPSFLDCLEVLVKNMNALLVKERERNERDRAKHDAEHKRQKDKEDREKQKQKAQDRKETEKKRTQKGDRRR